MGYSIYRPLELNPTRNSMRDPVKCVSARDMKEGIVCIPRKSQFFHIIYVQVPQLIGGGFNSHPMQLR